MALIFVRDSNIAVIKSFPAVVMNITFFVIVVIGFFVLRSQNDFTHTEGLRWPYGG